MKTRIVFILILVVVIGNQLLTAQNVTVEKYYPFPESNAVWTEAAEREEVDKPTNYTLYCYRLLNQDTVINSIKYHKLFTSNDLGLQNLKLAAFIRQDTLLKRIYILDRILYDFSLKVGDTISLEKGYFLRQSFDIMIVNRIDSILISGQYRKRINLERGGASYQWIEGIGNTGGLLTRLMSGITTCICANHLLCFGKNEQWIYHDYAGHYHYSDCFPITGIDDKKNSIGITLFPNPIQNISYLKFGSGYKRLEIINSMGIVVKTYNVENLKEVSISKSDFVSGMYLYRLYSNTNYNKSGKFIID